MDARTLDIAAEFCRIVDAADLLEYLGIEKTSSPAEARDALARKRKYLQGMQSNPKFKDSALFLIKHYKVLEDLLDLPAIHLEHMRQRREAAQLPIIELALDAMLATGHPTPEAERIIRSRALELDISLEKYEAILRERAQKIAVQLPAQPAPAAQRAGAVAAGVGEASSATTETERRLKGAAGHGWWDAAFTRMLLECIPSGPGDLVDIYCRTALSAVTLLPERRQLSYLGIDRSPERIAEAQAEVHDLGIPIELMVGLPEALPLPEESVDFVLSIRGLANLPDTMPAFAEAARVLRPGGRMICAEPDGLSETFYFEGHLVEYNAAFHALTARIDAMAGPGANVLGKPGLALGPQLPERMAAAGLRATRVAVHSSNTLKPRPFGKFVKQLRKYPLAMAQQAGLGPESGEVQWVNETLDALEASIPADTLGMAGQMLPMFLVVGVKES